jgi:hypothetical protein
MDTSTTVINLMDNIKIEKECVTINPLKPWLTINGNGFTIEQADANTKKYVFDIQNNGLLRTINVTNLNITGKSKYGFIYIPASTKYNDITVNFEDVTYTGPELICAKCSNVNITNCELVVAPGYCDTEGYLVDGNQIRLSGFVKIDKQVANSCRVMFRVHKKGSALIMSRGAVVLTENNTKVNSTSKKSGFAKFQNSKSALIIEENVFFKYRGVNSFIYGEEVDYVYIGDNSMVDVVVTGKLYCCAMLEVDTYMIVKPGATLMMYAIENVNRDPIIKLDKSKGLLIFDNPTHVLLYNNSGKKSCHGLALGNICYQQIQYLGVRSIEYWDQNDLPVTALGIGTATNHFINKDPFTYFDACVTMHSGTFKCAETKGYDGVTPFNSKTHSLKNTNVLRIEGAIIGT